MCHMTKVGVCSIHVSIYLDIEAIAFCLLRGLDANDVDGNLQPQIYEPNMEI